jgi:3-hydroxy-D-aspartate aldolase
MGTLGPNEPLIGVAGSRNRLTTPALVLDLDIFERNLATLLAHCVESGQNLRPHAKTHKSSQLARRQIDAGAVGVCCATLHEAEQMVAGGATGVLITSPVVGLDKIQRLQQLNKIADNLMIVVDNLDGLQAIEKSLLKNGDEMTVLVDIDVGMQRTGTSDPEQIVALAKHLSESESFSYGGVQAYSGRIQHIEDYAERRRVYGDQMTFLADILKVLEDAGFPPGIASGGGTGTHHIDQELGLFTELQAGSFIFMDVEYNAVDLANGPGNPFETALFIQCSVVSNNADSFVTIDGGYKCFATDGPKPEIFSENLPDSTYDRFGDEHGKINLGNGNYKPALGETITLITPHCDPTVNLHNYYHAVRGDTLVEILPIDARGVL